MVLYASRKWRHGCQPDMWLSTLGLWKRLRANNLDRAKRKHLRSSIPLSMLGGENNTSSWPHTASLRLILTGDTGKHTRDLGVGIQLAQEAPLPSERTGWPDHDLSNGRLVMLQARAAHVPSLRFRLMPSVCIAWQPRSAGQRIPSISAMSSSTKASPNITMYIHARLETTTCPPPNWKLSSMFRGRGLKLFSEHHICISRCHSLPATLR